MTVKEKLERYYTDPFSFIDNINLTIKGNNLNIFQKYKRLQNTTETIAIFSLIMWMLMGFDSTPVQLLYPLYHGPTSIIGSLIVGHGLPTLEQLAILYNEPYGIEVHWAAIVFYFLMFWFLSRHLDKNFGIIKSKNIAYSLTLTLFAIGVFEWYWLISFAYWQNQWWMLSFHGPQMTMELLNSAFILIGVIGILYFWVDSYIIENKVIIGRRWTFRFDRKALLLIGLSVFFAVLWWYYPGYVDTQTLPTMIGWQNSSHFAQTLYTVSIDSTSGIGIRYYIQNDWIHALNTLVKVLFTLTITYIGTVKKKNG